MVCMHSFQTLMSHESIHTSRVILNLKSGESKSGVTHCLTRDLMLRSFLSDVQVYE